MNDVAGDAPRSGTLPNPIPPVDLGTATLTPAGDVVAGSYASFTLTYTAGRFGIDDSGALRICFRFATDQSRPQFEDPTAPGYTVVTASNNAVLEVRYDPKGNVRPWDRTLAIKVVKGFLSAGDTITVRFGVTDGGAPGMRVQTFCEETFEFRVLVDPIATFNFQPLPVQPTIRIVAGEPVRFVAVVPTLRRVGETFTLNLKAEDAWGNPSDRCQADLRLQSDVVIDNLPESVAFTPGQDTLAIDDLRVNEPAHVRISLLADDGTVVAAANPLRVVAETPFLHYWGDLHGQSEETIGTNSAAAYFAFARDKAFLDAVGHQGNDFQITSPFWRTLDRLTAATDAPGRFVAVPGYEWSGNTALGGDRNVYFADEGRQIRRSSHALIEDTSDLATDCNTAQALFDALAEAGEWDVVTYAHCGGRYADIRLAHDGRFEKSVEIHSSWGTFEWLLEDALELGYRVGIVANSDGHKGRPGASYPGASLFGAIGGFTCFLAPELSRAAILDCMRKRRHYATTGGPTGRMVIDVRARCDDAATLYHDDPRLGPAAGTPARTALMGDIVHVPAGPVALDVDVVAAAPIDRVDLFNGLAHLETVRPYDSTALGNRVRVLWEGAEYRGRFRQVIWDGAAQLSDNAIVAARPINFFNPARTLEHPDERRLQWRALTTGNIGGFDLWLADRYGGTLKIESPLVQCGVPLEEIGFDDTVFDASGVLPRRLTLTRLPAAPAPTALRFTRPVDLAPDRDNALYIRVTLEDGTRAWTSPVYIYR